MDCDVIQPDLVAYHFGVIEQGARRAVEEHLVGCPICLGDFLTLKREIETADARPSVAAKDRLRRAVAREIGATPSHPGWSWWERPLALGLAGVTLVCAMFAVHVLASSPGSAPRSQAPHQIPL
jgi:anti-sigma factor RsiW